MRKALLAILLFFLIGSTVYSQENPIERYIITARSLDHADCVNSIRVKSYYFSNRKETIDTSYREYLARYKDEKLIARLSYSKDDPVPTQEIKYDSLGRITSLERRKYDGKNFRIVQHFSNNSRYPDSTNFYLDYKKTKSYINTFEDTLVVKQEYYTLDTLRTYRTFKYDNSGRMIEHIKINTENGFGITLSKSITGTEDKKTPYPNDTIRYEYSRAGDTIITRKYSKGVLEEIHKSINENGVTTEIVKEYSYNYYSGKTITREIRDSRNIIKYSFNREQDTLSILTQNRDSKGIKVDWKQLSSTSKSNTIFKTENDSRGNWVEKDEVRNGFLQRRILREFDYCDQL